jgi:uncharacterized protein (TIGR02284 family)
MDKEKSIEVLNTLIEINNDRMEGYLTAANETNEVDLKLLFSQCMQNSQKCKTELMHEVRVMGGTPIEGQTKTTGKLYRAWMDIKAALRGRDRKVILSSCEFGEDVAIETYNKALKSNLENISSQLQNLLNEQYALIKADHDKIKRMRDMLVEQK